MVNGFGLILRIAMLVISIEIAAFSALGWFYISRFSSAAEDRLRSRLLLVGQMIARNELAVSTISNVDVISNLIGAPCVNGLVVGGSGRVIVSANPAYLGRIANTIPGIGADWLAPAAPAERIMAGPDTLTGVTRIVGPTSTSPIYSSIISIGTSELNAQKRSIALWGWVMSSLFILLTSAAIILVAQRLITRRVDKSLRMLKDVEDGALDARIAVSYDDELGDLQRGINSMTSKVCTLLGQHRRKEEEISTILDALADGVIAIGPDGQVLRCNPSAATVLGHGADRGLAGQIGTLLPELPIKSPGWWQAPESLTAQGRLHFARTGPDGIPRSIELGHGPIHDSDGSVIGAVLVLQDVTSRKRAEDELHEAVDRLTSSNSELERFAYVASHDLQEPLRTITCFTQLLDRRLGNTLEQEYREDFNFIIQAAKRMSLLINDLLAYSRVNARGIQFSQVSLQNACAAAIDNLHDTIVATQAEITVGQLPDVVGDSVQLMQVFQNLMGNSIKFRQDGVTVHVEIEAEQRDGEWLISVTDNGIGIANTDQDIFEIFRRLHTTKSYPGSGVGLAICKKIIERLGGRIWFESEPGKGTRFTFTLPATVG